MLTRIGDMRSREVISVRDGARLGYLGDIEIDTESVSIETTSTRGRPFKGTKWRLVEVYAVRCRGKE